MGKPPKFVPELDDYPRIMITDLTEYQGELKDLTKREYNKLLKSFGEHDFFDQFKAWEAPDGIIYILDGHQRKRVFIGEGWLVPVPVQFIKAKSYEDAKKKLLVITSQYGRVTQEGWDDFTFDLDDEWIKQTVNFDALPLVFEDWDTGGGGGESKDAEPQISRADELQEIWQVKTGQVWRLPSRVEGQEHRIICGDCTDTAVVARVMGGEVAALFVIDAPYSVGYNDRSKDGSRGMTPLERFKPNQNHNSLKVENDDVPNFHEQWMPVMLSINKLKNWNAYLFCGIQSMIDWHIYLSQLGVKIHLPNIWVKDIPTPGFNFYRSRYEVCMLVGDGVVTMGTKSPMERWFGEDTQTTVWEVPAIQSAASVDDMGNSWFSGGSVNLNYHPNQKPVKLIQIPIRNSSDSGEIVVELFSGSGTTIIAAENLSRQCRAVEIEPKYVAVTLDRYERAFGIKPELIS